MLFIRLKKFPSIPTSFLNRKGYWVLSDAFSEFIIMFYFYILLIYKLRMYGCMCLVAQSCLTLCDPMD